MSGPVLLALRIILIVALYTFLAVALFTLWQSLKRQGQMLVPRKPPAITLTYPLGETIRSTRFQIPEVIIGRDPACSFSVDDKTVSAQHARFCYRQGQWWVEDLHSTNGTFLNGETVTSPLVVTHGDQLRFGQVIFDIGIGEPR